MEEESWEGPGYVVSKKEKGARTVRGTPAGTLSGDSVNAVSPTTPPHLSLQMPTTSSPRLYCMPPHCPPICHKILNQEKKGYIRGTFHFLVFYFLRHLQLNAFETDDCEWRHSVLRPSWWTDKINRISLVQSIFPQLIKPPDFSCPPFGSPYNNTLSPRWPGNITGWPWNLRACWDSSSQLAHWWLLHSYGQNNWDSSLKEGRFILAQFQRVRFIIIWAEHTGSGGMCWRTALYRTGKVHGNT